MFLEHLAQLRRDPLRQEDRDARPDAYELHVLDGTKPPEQVVELSVGKQKRIAAAQQHVAHLGMRFNVAERPLMLGMEVAALRQHKPIVEGNRRRQKSD